MLILYGLVLWRWPKGLLHLPEDGLNLGRIKLGATALRWLKYQPRVLDAWVAEHLQLIHHQFAAIPTVDQRSIHLTLPVRMGNSLELDLTPERLKKSAGIGRLLLISGEGGVGKTSLALAIARWSLEGKLTGWPVVPVLVEAELAEGETPLSRVGAILQRLTANATTLSPALVKALLARRRALLILDHYSELGDDSRRRLSPGSDEFPSAWVMVTSRRAERFAEQPLYHLRPQRLTVDGLMRFFTDYLCRVEAEEALDYDMQMRAVQRLRQITEEIVYEKQEITVLLAKLFIDVVLQQRRRGEGQTPVSVPALMLTYGHEDTVEILRQRHLQQVWQQFEANHAQQMEQAAQQWAAMAEAQRQSLERFNQQQRATYATRIQATGRG